MWFRNVILAAAAAAMLAIPPVPRGDANDAVSAPDPAAVVVAPQFTPVPASAEIHLVPLIERTFVNELAGPSLDLPTGRTSLAQLRSGTSVLRGQECPSGSGSYCSDSYPVCCSAGGRHRCATSRAAC